MKKKKPFLTLLLLLCVGFANGQTFVVDGLQYTVTTAPEVSVNKDGTTCPTGALTIPSLVTDPGTNIEYTVRTIEANSFENCSALTSVVIGDSLTSIGLSAFSGCSSLTSVTLPNSLTSIGDFAFNACSGLTSVTFGDSLTSIGQQAFGNCSGLTSVTFGDSLNSIGFAAFGNCSGLTSLTLPNSVTSIGDFAFFGCSGLTEVTVAWQTPLVISSDVFSGLTLSGITLKVPEGEIATYEAAAVWQDFSIEEDIVCFTIGDLKYTAVGSDTIVRVTKADACPTGALTIPSLVTDTSTNIEYTVRTIEGQAFQNCTGLTSVVIGDSLTTIGAGAFSGCSSLTSVTLPNSLTSIGSNAFESCSGLTSVTLPNSLTSIGLSAFSGCSSLTSVTLPNSLTSIGESAFESCSVLTSLTLPNSLTSIENSTFRNCSGLTSVTFGDSLTSIGQQAFDNCIGLTSVTLPNSLNSIGFAAFNGCIGLTSLTLPNSVTSIGDFAFQDCSGLTEVTVAWQTPLVITTNVFFGLTLSDITLKVPEGEIATYEAAAVWQDFSVEVNTLSTNENSLLNPSFFINPNPASYSIAVSGLKQTATYKLYNVLGAKIMKGTLSVNAKIEIEQLTNGVYFLKINNGTTLRFIKK